MAIINPLPYIIANGDPVDATPVQANFSQIVANVNASAALAVGNAAQQFLVATTANPAGAVPLAQAQADFAPITGSSQYAPAIGSPNYAAIGGSATQLFQVATATSAADAVPLAQVQADFAAIGGSATQLFQVATATGAADAVPLAQLGAYAQITGNSGVQFNVADASQPTQATALQQIVGAGQTGISQFSDPARQFGVTYTNSTNHPLIVIVVASAPNNSGSSWRMYGYVNSNEVWQITGTDASTPAPLFLIVPPGNTYSVVVNVSVGPPAIVAWTEY